MSPTINSSKELTAEAEDGTEDKAQPIRWQPVLDAMYRGGHVTRAPPEDDWDYELYHPMGKLSGLPHDEIQVALSYLENTGLIYESNDYGRISLTERGLQIGHERETTREKRRLEQWQGDRLNKANSMIAGFTLVLAFSAILQAVAVLTQMENPATSSLYGVLIIGLLIIAFLIFRNPANWHGGLLDVPKPG